MLAKRERVSDLPPPQSSLTHLPEAEREAIPIASRSAMLPLLLDLGILGRIGSERNPS